MMKREEMIEKCSAESYSETQARIYDFINHFYGKQNAKSEDNSAFAAQLVHSSFFLSFLGYAGIRDR